MLDTAPFAIPISADSVAPLGTGEFGPVLRLQRSRGDLVLRWVEGASQLLPLVGILGQCRHPALVLPCRMGLDLRGRAWIARPFWEGATLEEQPPSASDPRWPDLLRQWLEALDALHSGDWVHRDVKAANLLVGPAGAKLFDLDLAVSAAEAEAAPARAAGTRRWLAPEVLAGEPATPRSDLFGLGVAVARALLGPGSPQFTERFPGRDFWAASDLDPGELPADLQELVRSLVERDPSARPASAMAAISRLPGGQPQDGTLEPPPLLGRAEALLDSTRARLRRGRSLVLIAEDPSDREDVLTVLGAAAALEGRCVRVFDGVQEEREFLERADSLGEPTGDSAGDAALLVRLAPGCDGAILVECLVECLVESLVGLPVLAVLDREQSAAARHALGPDHARALDWEELGVVPLEGLQGHLGSRATLSVEGVIDTLARDLHERTEGRQSALEDALRHAEPLGVARHLTDGWLLQRERWPDGPLPGAPFSDSKPTPSDPVFEGVDIDGALARLEPMRLEGRLAASRTMADRLEAQRAPLDPGAALRLSMFRAELDLAEGNLDGAVRELEGSRASAEGELLQRLHVLLGDSAQRRGETESAGALYEGVLKASADPDTRLRAIVGAAHLELLAGEFEAVVGSLEGAPSEGARPETVGALHNLRGGALVRLGRLPEASLEFDAALGLGRASDDRGLAARALLNRAVVERNLGSFGEAEASLADAESLARPTDLLGVRALITHNLGTLLRDRGELLRARAALERALRLRRRAGDEYGIATTLGSLALIDLEQGMVGRARVQLGEASGLLEAGGHGGERAVIELHREIVGAILGTAEAEEVTPDPSAEQAASLAEARLRLLRARAGSDGDGVARAIRQAMANPAIAGGPAERFRFVSLAHSLAPSDLQRRDLAREMIQLAGELGPARVREGRFRTARALTIVELGECASEFSRDGRIDLEWAASTRLAAMCVGPGQAGERRRAARRAEELAALIQDGIPAESRARAQEHLLVTTGLRQDPAAVAPELELGLDWFTRINRELAASDNLDELLALVLDQALECTGARRGLMLLRQAEGLEVLEARHLGESEAGALDLQLSGSLVRSAMESGETIMTQDVATDPRFQGAASVRDLELRAILCVPIMDGAGAFGALYVDDDRPQSLFDETDARVLRALAEQAGAVARQLIAMKEIRHLNARLGEQVVAQKEELVAVRTQMRRAGRSPAIGGLVGESPAILALRDQVRRLAETDLPVLITGPSGSGKELVARALHSLGARDGGPLVVENMAALTDSLMESELFGHTRGAFTGATGARIGLFEEAHGGTLFLDEIADLQPALQAKLLRVLESGEFRRLGESSTRRADVRLVAATNADMAERVGAGAFRQDLYFRLNAAEIRLPSLRDRVEDIPVLVEYFLEILEERHGLQKPMATAVLKRLADRPWPGEVRELRNEVERLFLLSGDAIDGPELVREASAAITSSAEDAAPYTLEYAERRAIVRALDAAQGNRAEAARLLEVSRAGFYNKLKRFGIE